MALLIVTPAVLIANERLLAAAPIKPLVGVQGAPVQPYVLSKVTEPLSVIAPLTIIPPPEEIALRLTPDPTPTELSVIAINVIPCLEPLVLFKVRVGVSPAVVMLKINAVV